MWGYLQKLKSSQNPIKAIKKVTNLKSIIHNFVSFIKYLQKTYKIFIKIKNFSSKH